MSILAFILLCVVLGLVVYGVNTYLPLPAPIKTLILFAVLVILVLILANALGLFGFDTQIPRIR